MYTSPNEWNRQIRRSLFTWQEMFCFFFSFHSFLKEGFSCTFFTWPTPTVLVFIFKELTSQKTQFLLIFSVIPLSHKGKGTCPQFVYRRSPLSHVSSQSFGPCLNSIFDSVACFWEGKQCLFVETLKVLQADRCYINEISFQLLLLYSIELSYITITKETSPPTQQCPFSSWHYSCSSPHK